ncbi:MAG: translation initiation factor IF-2 [Candidatus Nomurabacteria bacterium]|nr:translation initiation factor IF-2 [Candidatus Nomurabacteria bacterium]
MENKNDNQIERPPIVAVMGHIDHGKSTILDYIRKTNITEREAGGITQHISAYEVVHKDEKGKDKKITFLDTPGHEAFSKMRERGAKIADIAILVVSAEDGVKPQTIEAYKTIVDSKTPCIVAINKIDKPGADIEKTKMSLAENEIYLEGYGGTTPFALVSAKTGAGIDELLTLILVLAEMESFTGNANAGAEGFILESNLDSKRGIQATLIIKNGTLKKGMLVTVEDAICATRIMENFLGKTVSEATFSSPVRLVGFDKVPKVGGAFIGYQNKKEAEEAVKNWKNKTSGTSTDKAEDSGKKLIPIILKADVSGSLEAIEKEIGKINTENAEFRIVQKGVGPISENDLKGAGGLQNMIIIGFNVKTDKNAIEYADRLGVTLSSFDIIYKMTDWLKEEMEKRRPKIETVQTIGKAKILKAFSQTKERQIVGGKVIEGNILIDQVVKIIRRENEIGRARIVNLEKGKTKTSSVEEGTEFGMMIESKIEIVAGDVVECFALVQK